MTNVITETTRQQAILDPNIIPEDLPFIDSGTIEVPNNISDHKATYIKLPFQYDTEGAYNRLIWLYRKANFTLLKQKISNYDWNCLREGTADEACTKFNNIFLDFVRSCIPNKNVLIRPDDKPWYDSEIRRVSRKRDRLKRNRLLARYAPPPPSWGIWQIYPVLKINHCRIECKMFALCIWWP